MGAHPGSLGAARPNAEAFSATEGAHAEATGGGDRAGDYGKTGGVHAYKPRGAHGRGLEGFKESPKAPPGGDSLPPDPLGRGATAGTAVFLLDAVCRGARRSRSPT